MLGIGGPSDDLQEPSFKSTRAETKEKCANCNNRIKLFLVVFKLGIWKRLENVIGYRQSNHQVVFLVRPSSLPYQLAIQKHRGNFVLKTLKHVP